MDACCIDYRTREFVDQVSNLEWPDEPDEKLARKGTLFRMVGDLIYRAERVVMYEWPEMTFMKPDDVWACKEKGVREHPATARFLLSLKATPYPVKKNAVPYCRKKLLTFRGLACAAKGEWPAKENSAEAKTDATED